MNKRIPKIGVIACAVLERELKYFRVGRENLVAVEILEQGLHNEPDKLRSELQAAIDRMEQNPEVEAVALMYGLCSRGVEGVHTSRVRQVIPRAHDCITFFLGSKERYADYVAANPGTYWYTPGWIDTGTQPGKERYETSYREYLERYGEDNAEYLMEFEQSWIREYSCAAYVDLGIGNVEKDIAFTRECADYLKWKFDRLDGDSSLLESLLDGDWDEERFLVLRPGQVLKMTGDDRIIETRKQ
jgi:hypothetical protein